MNERIRQLWSQSENELDQDFASGKIPINIDRYWLDLMQEKFAELIVRECVQVINADIDITIIAGESEKSWKMGMECGMGLIKEHFGVEE